MSSKRASVAKIRTLLINGREFDVPRYIHRHLEPKSWSVSIAGIRKYFRDEAYGGLDRSLTEAKVFLGQVMRQDDEALFKYAQITVHVYAPKDGLSSVHGFFKQRDGKDMSYFVGYVAPEADFWPSIRYSFQDMPGWLAKVDFSELKKTWLKMHREQLHHIYMRDDFKKFLDEILTNEQQLALAL